MGYIVRHFTLQCNLINYTYACWQPHELYMCILGLFQCSINAQRAGRCMWHHQVATNKNQLGTWELLESRFVLYWPLCWGFTKKKCMQMAFCCHVIWFLSLISLCKMFVLEMWQTDCKITEPIQKGVIQLLLYAKPWISGGGTFQMTGMSTVCSTVCSVDNNNKTMKSLSFALCDGGCYRWPVIRKAFSHHDVIIQSAKFFVEGQTSVPIETTNKANLDLRNGK